MDDVKLYEIIIAEYRFQVLLNWDRTKFFLTLNLTILGTTAGAIRFDVINALSAIALFSLGAFAALLGRHATTKGHQYYREIALKKSELEKKLRLEVAPRSTPGQQAAPSFFGSLDQWLSRPLLRSSITGAIAWFFLAIAGLNVLGIIQAVVWAVQGKY